MDIRKFIFALTGLVALTACSNEADEVTPGVTTEPQSGIPILLSCNVNQAEIITRASSGIQSTQLDRGEQVNVYITSTGATYNPKVYNINNSGAMAPVGNIFPYFPTNGSSVDVYALYPLAVTNATTSFSIQDNQDGSKAYKASDLMYGQPLDEYGNKRSIAPDQAAQMLTFKHLLSKVTVVLVSGQGDPNIANSTIQLCNIYKTIGINAAAGTLNTLHGEPGFVTITENGAGTRSCIIPPQAIGTGYFLKIRLTGGDVIYYSPDQSFNIESGKEYRFTVTVNQNQLKVKYSVEPWANTQDGLGNDNNVYAGKPAFNS